MIDGAAEQTWDNAQWQPMAFLMAGSQPKETDFSGRYKLLWDNQYLYLQAQIIDDILFDLSDGILYGEHDWKRNLYPN